MMILFSDVCIARRVRASAPSNVTRMEYEMIKLLWKNFKVLSCSYVFEKAEVRHIRNVNNFKFFTNPARNFREKT